MTPERLAIIKDSLDKRQPDLTVIMEHVCKPHNLAAVARTLEAVGGIDIHAITSLTSIRLSQMSAGGVRRWINVHKHQSAKSGLEHLKQKGFRVIATTLSERARDYREIDYTRPTAILVGEEQEGLSEQTLALADEDVTIPMAGMVQSLNVSVASALILYEAYRQREQAGMFQQRSLDDNSYKRMLFEACHPQVARYCQAKNLPYPEIDDNAELLEPVSGSTTFSEQSFTQWIKSNSA
jgi:tRNA (guanosine-2'-O-)-methyltransferase